MKRKFTKYPSKITASRESEYYAKKAKEEAEEDERVRSNLEIAQKYAPILSREGYDGEYFVTWVEEEHYYDDLRDPDNLRGVIWNFVLGYICERDDYGGSAQEEEADEVTDKILSQGNGVDACEDVMSSEICYRDSDNDDRVVALDAGMSDEEVEEMLAAHPSYYRSTLDRFDACDKVDACGDTKYFANMVSASIDDGDYKDEFLVEGYYDNQRRGLAESAETSDVSALNELINEYANKGYYIAVHNLTDGTITEFSPDNWFDDLARDGGAILFMS